MMFKKTNVTRKLFWDDVRQVCIQNDYYTSGTVDQYQKLLTSIEKMENITDSKLMQIAQNIYDHSNVERIMNEGGVDECGVMSSILFNLSEKVHTFYTVEEV